MLSEDGAKAKAGHAALPMLFAAALWHIRANRLIANYAFQPQTQPKTPTQKANLIHTHADKLKVWLESIWLIGGGQNHVRERGIWNTLRSLKLSQGIIMELIC